MTAHYDKLMEIIASSKDANLAVLVAIKVFEAFSTYPEMPPEQILEKLREQLQTFLPSGPDCPAGLPEIA